MKTVMNESSGTSQRRRWMMMMMMMMMIVVMVMVGDIASALPNNNDSINRDKQSVGLMVLPGGKGIKVDDDNDSDCENYYLIVIGVLTLVLLSL